MSFISFEFPAVHIDLVISTVANLTRPNVQHMQIVPSRIDTELGFVDWYRVVFFAGSPAFTMRTIYAALETEGIYDVLLRHWK